MRWTYPTTLPAIGLALLVVAAVPARAQAPAVPASTIVARIGSQVVTADELERRIASVPPYQLRSFGATADEIRRNFLERVFVREILMAEGALEQRLGQRADVEERLRGVMRSATLSAVRREMERAPVEEAEIRAYYDANAAKFHSPMRIAIWRILTPTREDALKVIAAVKDDKGGKRWTELARESLDKATAMRNGNLGFVAPDGTTGEAGVKVDPKLFAAATTVGDTEVLGVPVQEGERFAVIWRRQTMKAVDRTLEQETPSIRQVLVHARIEAKIKETLDRLRRDTRTEEHPELVDQLEVTGTGNIQPTRRPGGLAVSRRAGAGAPTPQPGGLR